MTFLTPCFIWISRSVNLSNTRNKLSTEKLAGKTIDYIIHHIQISNLWIKFGRIFIKLINVHWILKQNKEILDYKKNGNLENKHRLMFSVFMLQEVVCSTARIYYLITVTSEERQKQIFYFLQSSSPAHLGRLRLPMVSLTNRKINWYFHYIFSI